MIALFAIFLVAGNGFPDTSATPEQGFWMLFGQEMPDSVTDSECHGAFWMDHNLAIRFQVDAAEIGSLTSGYQPIEWTNVESKFESPLYFEEFDGRWLASQITNKKCYTQTKRTSEGYTTFNYLVIDQDDNTVYGISEGTVGDPIPTLQDGQEENFPVPEP